MSEHDILPTPSVSDLWNLEYLRHLESASYVRFGRAYGGRPVDDERERLYERQSLHIPAFTQEQWNGEIAINKKKAFLAVQVLCANDYGRNGILTEASVRSSDRRWGTEEDARLYGNMLLEKLPSSYEDRRAYLRDLHDALCKSVSGDAVREGLNRHHGRNMDPWPDDPSLTHAPQCADSLLPEDPALTGRRVRAEFTI